MKHAKPSRLLSALLLSSVLLGGAAYAQPDPEDLAGQPEALQALLARTLEQDPQLLVARALKVASNERRLQARSRFAPNLNAEASFGRSKDTLYNVPVDGETDQSSVGVSWNLFNAGADTAELRGATRELAAAHEDVRRAREEIGERVAYAYAELLRQQALLPASRQRMDEASRLVALVGRATEAGKLAPSDENQARAAMLDAEVSHGQLLADLRASRDRLAILTGVTLRPPQAVQLPASYFLADAPAGDAGVEAAARLRAQAAEARVLPWVSTISPRVDLSYNRLLNNETRPVSEPQSVEGWQIVARWDLPLGGENQARRAEAIARAAAAQAEADRVERTQLSELATLPPRMAHSRTAMGQLDEQIKQYDALVRAGAMQYQAGKRSLLQLVQLLDSRYVAQQRRAEENFKLVTAQLRYLALRGDFLPALGLTPD